MHPELDDNSNYGDTLDIITHSEGENMSMQTIARCFEAMLLWTVVCVKIEEKAREIGIGYSKYETNTLLTGVIWYSHGYLSSKTSPLPPNCIIGDLDKQIEKKRKYAQNTFGKCRQQQHEIFSDRHHVVCRSHHHRQKYCHSVRRLKCWG